MQGEEEKKAPAQQQSLTQKFNAFVSKARKPQEQQSNFQTFQSDPDLEGQTINLRDSSGAPQSA